MEGNFSQVIRAYLSSPQFAALAPSSQYNWRRALELAGAALGTHQVELIRPSIMQVYIDEFSQTPGKQEVARTALRALETWAVVRDLLPYPIMTGVQTIGGLGGHEPWTDEQVETAIAHARPDLARVITLAINTGQRGSDIVKMRWSDIEEQEGRKGINVTQQKTGKRLWIPLSSDFSDQISKWERRPPFFLILAPDGVAFSRGRLSHDWTKERDGNPALAHHRKRGLVLHGLRASAVVRLRKMGFTDLEIASFIGMSPPMVARYSRLADQKKMAMATIERIENLRADKINSLQVKSLKS